MPDAVLVGGSAAALYAGHRVSFDHDVLADLESTFDTVLEALEATDGWVTNRVTPYKMILGQLGDIEAGVEAGQPPGGVRSQVVRQLSDPRPRDTTVLAELPRYKGLEVRWQDWDVVRAQQQRQEDEQ